VVRLRGYHPQIVTLSTPSTAPVIAATRLRAGNADSARAAVSLLTEAIGIATQLRWACRADAVSR
jgi:hypothetical protein